MKYLSFTGLLLLSSLNFSYAQQTETAQYTAHYKVESHLQQNWFTLEARIEAIQESTLSAQTSGRIKAINFDVNDYVEQGALLIQLRDKQQQAALKQVQAQLVQANANNDDAQAQLKRTAPLYKKGAVSKGNYDSIKARAISAKAAVKANKALLEQATDQLSYTQIRAPFSGIVKTRHVEIGESVNPGSRVMTGLSLAHLRAVADIPQRLAPYMNKQKEFQVTHLGKPLTTSKVTVFPYADPSSHSFKVRVEINSEGSHLFPGMWVKLNIPVGQENVLTVPKSAVMEKGELSTVLVVSDNGAKLRQVRLGKQYKGQIEILAGLRIGESIYTDAYAQLAEQGK